MNTLGSRQFTDLAGYFVRAGVAGPLAILSRQPKPAIISIHGVGGYSLKDQAQATLSNLNLRQKDLVDLSVARVVEIMQKSSKQVTSW